MWAYSKMERTDACAGSLHFLSLRFSTFASIWRAIHLVWMHESNFYHHLQDSTGPWLQWWNRGVFHNPPLKSTDVHGDGTYDCTLFCLAFATCNKHCRIQVFAFCFYSFCLECCERQQRLVAPTRLNITRLCGLGSYSFLSHLSIL